MPEQVSLWRRFRRAAGLARCKERYTNKRTPELVGLRCYQTEGHEGLHTGGAKWAPIKWVKR